MSDSCRETKRVGRLVLTIRFMSEPFDEEFVSGTSSYALRQYDHTVIAVDVRKGKNPPYFGSDTLGRHWTDD